MTVNPTESAKPRSPALHIWSVIMFVMAVLLAAWTVITLVVARINYDPRATSFPYYAYVVVALILYVLPALIALVLGLVFRHRANR